uniref:TPR_REGION domain-containing protein n=1 Tax=Heterorhabditis bacteriophora TaxID=37862 RepID=A0A1I7X4W7_HETBA
MPIEEKDKDGLRPIELAIKAKNRSALETLLKSLYVIHFFLLIYQLNWYDFSVLRPRFMRLKMQILLAAARIHRKESRLDRAVDMCSEAATHADTEDLLFEVLLLRAKCHFDRHDVDKARSDVRAATQLRPGDDEARHLLNTLSLPNTNTSKL